MKVKLRVATLLMASKSKASTNASQPDITDYIQRQKPCNNKRQLSSPIEDLPHKKPIMETNIEGASEQERLDKLSHLPPDLKLLYDSLSVCLDNIDRKIDPDLSAQVVNVETRQTESESRLTKIEKENQELKQRLVNIEDKLLEKSIVISGISEDKYEESEPRRSKLNTEIANVLCGNTYEEKLQMASTLQIESTEHIGKFNPTKGRPITVKFANKSDADLILKNKKMLSKGIFVDKCYSTETERERKSLRPILSAARRLEEYRGKCKLDGTDLIIRGKRYSFENLFELPQNLNPEVVSSRQDAMHYGFFGEFNPLSNFHPAVFTCNGTQYCHTKQFIQATKAALAKDIESLDAILSSTSALKCKELGRSIQNCNIQEWNNKAKELCYPGLLCKFQQNPGLVAFLKSTGDKTLLECCYDTIWGNGVPLSSEECIETSKYKNQGIQGEMLEMVCATLRSQSQSVNVIPCGNTKMLSTTVHVGTADQHDQSLECPR